VFQLDNGFYKKIIDAKNDKVIFDLDECKIKFDFSQIWL